MPKVAFGNAKPYVCYDNLIVARWCGAHSKNSLLTLVVPSWALFAPLWKVVFFEKWVREIEVCDFVAEIIDKKAGVSP